MTVSGVEAPTSPTGLAAATTIPTSPDKDMFLQLLVAQMRNQDPANPTDSAEFLAQTAQFTALEKMQQVADQTTQLVALQVAFGASGMVGHTVSYVGPDGELLSGAVNSVRFEATGPVLQVNGEDVHFADIHAMGDGTTDLTDVPVDPANPTEPVQTRPYTVL